MKKQIEENFICKPALCQCYKKGIYDIKKYKNPDLINIFYCQYDNKICRKKCK